MFNKIVNDQIRSFLNGRSDVRRVGEILEVCLKDGRATAKILLRGENAPVSISANYRLSGRTLYVSNVKSGKQWLDALADIFENKYSRIDLNKYGWAADIASWIL